MEGPLSCFSSSGFMRRRRKRQPSRPGSDSRPLASYRPHGLLAMLLVADRSRVAGAFCGLAAGGSSSRVGSATKEGLRQWVGHWARRAILRPRCATLAPTTEAGGERALSSDSRSQKNGSSQNGSSRKRSPGTPGLVGVGVGVDREPVWNAHGSPKVGESEGATGYVAKDRDYKILTLENLNSRAVEPSRVRRSVLHHLGAARRLTSYQFACLAMASSRHCDIHLVTEVCETARSVGITTNVRFMTNLVNAASKKRRWVMAAQLLQLMRSYGVEPNDVTFTSVLSEMSKAKQHHMAEEMMQTENLQGNLDAYNALISGCASCRGYDRAIGYYKSMVKAGVQPDTMTFSSLIATTRDGTESGVERGFAVVEMMKEAGLRPSTYCMNSLMAVSVNARQPNTALEIFKEMERDGIPRDVVSYNTAIWACDKLGDSNGAVRLLREARQSSVVPDDFSYNSVISALGHSSLWQEAIEIFEEMHEVGVQPGLMTYNTLIAGCVRAGHPQEALSIFSLMEERNIKRDQYSYAGALHACLHLRDAEMSMGLLEKMEQDGMPANAMGYATAMRTCARCDKSFEAVLLYAQSLKLGIVPTKVTYKALLEAFAEDRSAERAVWVLDEMEDMQVEIEHEHLMEVLAACTTQTDIALRVLRLNTELDLHVALQMYTKGLEVCIAAGDYEASLDAVELMSQVGLQPEPQQEKRMLQACYDPERHDKPGAVRQGQSDHPSSTSRSNTFQDQQR